MAAPLSRISIIIPVHNEAEELEELFRKFWKEGVEDRHRVGEVLLVENGSTDQTYEACQRLSREFPGLVKTERVAQASYGAALKKGMESASQDILCLLECDFLDWSFLKESGDLIRSGQADFVVGSKRAPGARDLRPLKRRMLTALFNIGLKVFFRFPGTDTHGLKAIRGEAARQLCAAAQTGGEVFQTELVLLAHRFGLKVVEIPVAVRETRPTKIRIVKRLPKVAGVVWELWRSLRRFPREKESRRTLVQNLFSARAVVAGLLVLALIFQLMVLTKARFLYPVAEVLFFLFLAVCLGSLARLLGRRRALIPVLLLIILVRLPFYFSPEGLITTSDNATEALQCQEIRMTRTVPYFLLEAIRHIGTFKYMNVSFLWDVGGDRYILFLLMQLAFYLAFLVLFFKLLEPYIAPAVLLFLAFFHFAFIEKVFDYSLSIRGGPYLEMMVFLLLGGVLLDFEFKSGWRVAAAGYCWGFAVYLHQLSLVFVLAFLLTALLSAWRLRRLWRAAAWTAGGLLVGMSHWFFYLLFFRQKPVAFNAFEQVHLIGFRDVNWNLLPKTWVAFRTAFWNIFQYEFRFGTEVFPRGRLTPILQALNQAVPAVSLAVLVVGLGLAVSRLVRLLRGRERLGPRTWLPVFFILLLLGGLAKMAILQLPLLEPRHNFEIAFLIMASYALALSAAWRVRPKSVRAVGAALLAVFLLASSCPHIATFLKVASHKQRAYAELVDRLKTEKVRLLTTDFNIAYTVYFLSGRTVKVSPSFGPMNLDLFYRKMTAEVDSTPRRNKAFLFYGENSYVAAWYKEVARQKKENLQNNLRSRGVPYRVVELEDYTLVIPQPRD